MARTHRTTAVLIGAATLALALRASAESPPPVPEPSPSWLAAADTAPLTFTAPRLRIYDPAGDLAVEVAGREAISRGGVHEVRDVRFLLDVTRQADAPARGSTLDGRAETARYAPGEQMLDFIGRVALDLYVGTPAQLRGGGQVGLPPVGTLRVPALNMAYEPERPTEALVASPGRVWALFRDPAGATEITGLRLDLNLVARRLKIERDARVLISGPLLSGIANARPGEANEPGQAPLARVVPQGAIITAHGGVVLEDIQPRRDGDLPADARATMPAGRLVFNGPVVVEQENVRLVASRLVLIGVDGRVGQVLATDVRLDARRPEGRDGRARVAAEAASIDYRMERTAPGAPPQGRLRLRGAPGNPAELVYEVAGRLAPLPVVGQQIEIDLPSGAIRLE